MIGSIIGGGLSLIGGVVGGIASKGARDAASRAYEEALAEIRAIGAPPDLSKRILFEKFQQAGVLTPDLEQAVEVGVSRESQIQEDPSLRRAQMDALSMLQQRGQAGLTAQERAAFNELRNQVAKEQESKRAQILQSMQQRGLAGSGAELAAQLGASQAAANLESAEADRLAAQASQNALNAITASAQQAGQIRGKDFDVSQAKAKAADIFKQYDVQNRRDTQMRNIQSRNLAQQQNLQRQQHIADTNISLENQERLRQQEARRTNWLDQLDWAKAKAGMQGGIAQGRSQEADAIQKGWTEIGGGLGSAVSGAFNKETETPTKSEPPKKTLPKR